MFRNFLLEPEQKELLIMMVEAMRNTTGEHRQGFLFSNQVGGPYIIHDGLPDRKVRAYIGDMEILTQIGLLIRTYIGRGTPVYDITPLGYKYYEQMKLSSDQPVRRVEEKIRNYLDSDYFKRKYASAFQKWTSANNKLWSTDSEKQLTEIGHLCREAMQEFVTVLVDQFKPPQVDTDKAHTVARLKAVIKSKANQLGKTHTPFLEALIAYWGTVSDLAQRQEHAGLKEGQSLVWEDARRVVFQTANVMFEIDASLSRNPISV